MRSGLVSTIIPVYNRPTLVVEAIESVLAQTYRPIEIIVVDDGSTDSTAAVVEQMMTAHPEISLLRQPNSGPGPARQKGIEAASGEFIQFLDSDDLLAPEKFARQLALLEKHPECGASYGWTIRYSLGSDKDLTPAKWTSRKFDSMFPSFLSDRWWDTSTPLYRATLILQNGPWLNLRQEEDWEFDCRLAAQGVRLTMVEAIVSETRVVPESRLSLMGSSDPIMLRDRSVARGKILQHAAIAGIEPDEPHMRHFIDSSFLVARQCAAAGLVTEAETLVRHLNKVAPRKLMSLYLLSGKYIGLQRTTQLAEGAHRILRRGKERAVS